VTKCYQVSEQTEVARGGCGARAGSQGAVSGKKYCSGPDVSHPAEFCCLLHWSLPADLMLRTCRDIREELPERVWC